MMSKLFSGEFSDYVKCQECHFESARKVTFCGLHFKNLNHLALNRIHSWTCLLC